MKDRLKWFLEDHIPSAICGIGMGLVGLGAGLGGAIPLLIAGAVTTIAGMAAVDRINGPENWRPLTSVVVSLFAFACPAPDANNAAPAGPKPADTPLVSPACDNKKVNTAFLSPKKATADFSHVNFKPVAANRVTYHPAIQQQSLSV